ncbi:hypothetical protein J5N97_011372 [Dioscorea zingiberensis]|uniref:RNase H type-1 domain-containing protein n=1 Tax=Dioscorea zingiberensis TaxID=325984 RepID=A0A9D5HPI4_9LILI|nr:hypothetical protein J5N97_011372 [Dioscorea zingiberensis]
MKPQQGFIKCNVDAAVFKDRGQIGFGCVLRDENGSFIAARNGLLVAAGDPVLAEALSCREALSWIKELGLLNVCMESDCQLFINAVKGEFPDSSYFGLVVCDCKNLVKDLENCLLSFSRRSANQVAHALARAAGFMPDVGCWMSHPPPFILDVLAYDLI